ncbi:MAG: hypothetical protein ACRDD7_14675 [Peptostreptococcaceae bacterium]
MVEFIVCMNEFDKIKAEDILIKRNSTRRTQIGKFYFVLKENVMAYDVIIETLEFGKVARCIYTKEYYERYIVPQIQQKLAA